MYNCVTQILMFSQCHTPPLPLPKALNLEPHNRSRILCSRSPALTRFVSSPVDLVMRVLGPGSWVLTAAEAEALIILLGRAEPR